VDNVSEELDGNSPMIYTPKSQLRGSLVRLRSINSNHELPNSLSSDKNSDCTTVLSVESRHTYASSRSSESCGVALLCALGSTGYPVRRLERDLNIPNSHYGVYLRSIQGVLVSHDRHSQMIAIVQNDDDIFAYHLWVKGTTLESVEP
jgi:hypothetical protein